MHVARRLPLAALALAAGCLAQSLPARAACDVPGARIEEALARRGELREEANQQAVRDLRTLRDAAIVLETYKYEAECTRLLAIVKALAADPERAVEQSGDTDEDKAEGLAQARKPKLPAGEPGGAAKAK